MSNPSPDRRPAPRQTLRFYRAYNRTLGLAYATLLLGLAAFFALQLRQSLRDEVSFIEGQVERHGQFLEFVLRSSSDAIESLRMAASSSRQSGRGCTIGRFARQQGEVQESGNGFTRDAAANRDAGGNLVGSGPLAHRSEDFYCDLGAVLGLNNHLYAMAFHLPNAARTRFVAREGFQLQFPWRPSPGLPPQAELLRDPIWRLGQPEANPDHLKYWAPPFFGGQEVGLLVPVAAPVYADDHFMGVVAIDLSMDYLNRVNGWFGYPLGTVSVVDAQGQVLAHPGLFTDPLKVQAPGRFGDVFPQAQLASVESLTDLEPGRAGLRDGAIVIRRPFLAAPWHLVYSVPRTALWGKLLRERGAGMAAVLAALGLLMAVTYRTTARDFVRPAALLVSHVDAQSRLEPQPVPAVPAAWRPWFESVSRAFGESLQLGSLRRELDIAARLQQSILPRHWPEDPRFTLWGSMQPAKDIGGDFYDHFALADGRYGLVVADVSGKGISAGLFAMVSKTLMRSVATQRQLPPGAVTRHVNEALCADNDEAMFVTTFYGQYDPASGHLVLASAGHPPAMLVRADGTVQWQARTGNPPLGAMEGVEFRDLELQLAPGETLLVFTDGVTEATDGALREFGSPRLEALFASQPPATPRQAVERVREAVTRFCDGAAPFDDITCVALRCNRLGAST